MAADGGSFAERLMAQLGLDVGPWIAGIEKAKAKTNELAEHLEKKSVELQSTLSANSAFGATMPILDGLRKAFGAFTSEVPKAASAIGRVFIDGLKGSLSVGKNVLADVARGLAIVMPKVFHDDLKSGLRKGWADFSGEIKKLWAELPSASALARPFVAVASAIASGAKAYYTSLLTPLATAFSSFMGSIGPAVSAVTSTLGGLTFGLIRNVLGGIVPLLSSVMGAMGNIFNTLAPLVSKAFSGFVAVAGFAVKGIMSVFGTLLGFFTSLVGQIAGIFGSLVGAIANVAGAIVEKLVSAGKSVARFMADLVGLPTSFDDVLRRMSKSASDFVEDVTKFRFAFRDFADDAAESILGFGQKVGRSQAELVKMAANIQSILFTMGLARDQSARFSTQLVKLAIDLASFNNISDTGAMERLISGIVGNHRALRLLGIGITEATLSQELFNLGLAKTVQEATDVQKVMARLSIVFRSTSDAQGDAERTMDSFANVMKRISAVVTNVLTEVGLVLNEGILKALGRDDEGGIQKFLNDLEQDLYVIFSVVRAISIEFIKLGVQGVGWLANWIGSLGGAEGVILRVQQGIEALKIGFASVTLVVQALVPIFAGVGVAIKQIFTYISQSAKVAFLDMRADLKRFTADLLGSILFNNESAAAIARGQADALDRESSRAGTAAAEAFVLAKREMIAVGEIIASVMRLIQGETLGMTAVFREYGTTTEDVYNTYVRSAMEGTIAYLRTAQTEMARFGEEAREAAGNIREIGDLMQRVPRFESPYGSSRETSNFGEGIPGFIPMPHGGVVPYHGRRYGRGLGEFNDPRNPGVMLSGEGAGEGGWQFSGEGDSGSNPWLGVPDESGFAEGGWVDGPSGADRVRARLTAGEFVVPPGPAARNRRTLEAIRAGRRPGAGRGVTLNVTQNFYDSRMTPRDVAAELQRLARQGINFGGAK